MKSIKSYFILVLALIITGVISISTLNSYKSEQKLIAHMEQNDLETKERLIKEKMSDWLNTAKVSVVGISKIPDIQKAFAEKDRERLKELCLPIFKEVKEEGVAQFQFHLAPAISFFRLHQVDKFGDDLASFRFTVIDCNKDKKLVMGLEEGKGGYGFRVVMPMFYNGEHTGSVEYGMDFNKKFIEDQIKVKLGGEYFVYQADDKLIRWGGNDGQVASGKAGEGLLVGTLEKDVYEVPNNILSEVLKTKKMKYIISSDEKKTIMLLPVQDYKGEARGYIKAVYDRTETTNKLTLALRESIGISIVLLLIAIVIMYITISRTFKPMGKLVETMEVAKSGDLTVQADLRKTGRNEIGKIAEIFNSMVNIQRELISDIQTAAERLSASGQQLSTTIGEQTVSVQDSMDVLANTTHIIINNVNNMANIKQNVDHVVSGADSVADVTGKVVKNSEDVKRQADKGSEMMVDTEKVIEDVVKINESINLTAGDLEQATQKIEEIVDVISGIADQTNLLALNAAIEAARAGESGKGFAVVAEEVRKLAEQSASSTREIASIVTDIQSKTNRTVELIKNSKDITLKGQRSAKETSDTIVEIAQAINYISKEMQGIAFISDEQAVKSNKINTIISEANSDYEQASKSLLEITENMQEQGSAFEEITATTQELSTMAEELLISTRKFKVK